MVTKKQGSKGAFLLAPSLAAGVDVIRRHAADIGEGAGVYRMLNEAGEVLYVGKAKSLKRRIVSYTRPLLLPARLQRMIAQTRSMEFIKTQTESEALLIESNLIKSLRPKYNVLLKDDKTYPYILMTQNHDFPQILKFRGKPDKNGIYFGPFASAVAVNETLSLLQRVFMLRNCTDSYFLARKTPCLQYHIKRCTAPCVGYVDAKGYAIQVRDARDFLSGKSREVQERLRGKMVQASAGEDYEVAAWYRDRIGYLTQIQTRQGGDAAMVGDADVMAIDVREGHVCIQVFFYRAGQSYGNRVFFLPLDYKAGAADLLSGFIAQFYQSRPTPACILTNVEPADIRVLEQAFGARISYAKHGNGAGLVRLVERNARDALARYLAQKGSDRKILGDLAALFGLAGIPQRIEIYDNSHISGTNMVGAMVVASPSGFEKKAYRTFNIRTAGASDDYAMMHEVILRRFGRKSLEHIDKEKENTPDLLLIDGGQGQLNAALDVLDELHLSSKMAVVGIAKGEKRNAGREKFFMRGREMFQLPPHDPVLHYLQRLRDEAHRFAIGTHRARRGKELTGSRLDDIPGIGARRKKALLLHFGSAKAVGDAPLDEIAKVEGVSKKLARQIYDFFHQE